MKTDKTYYHLKMKDEDGQAGHACRSRRSGTGLECLLPEEYRADLAWLLSKERREMLTGTLEWAEDAGDNKQPATPGLPRSKCGCFQKGNTRAFSNCFQFGKDWKTLENSAKAPQTATAKHASICNKLRNYLGIT